jgi:hypothetical protein
MLTEARQKVARAARETAASAGEKARHFADEKKTGTADRIDTYGSALHESARSLEGQDPNIAWLTHRAADRLNQAAQYVRGRDFNGLREDAANFARRHPAVFFGGLFVAGLVIGNLAKATASRGGHEEEWDFEGLPAASNPDI